MKKITVFVGMLAMVAFFSTSVVAQDKTKDTKTTTTQVKSDAKTPASTDKKAGTTKEACKPGCTMNKDKCCDKDKKATTAPDKK